jgi:HD-like signal output (HDOD) protein
MIPGNQSLIPEKFEIPPLPKIYFRIADAIHNPSLSISSIGDIIAKDGCLSTHILRMINHVIYHPHRRIHSLKDLLLHIGREEIQAVVLGTLVPTLFKNIREGLINIHTFWKHNIACGITAQFIALNLNRTTPLRTSWLDCCMI